MTTQIGTMSEHLLSAVEQLRVFQVRGQTVVLGSDLAAICRVTTRNSNKGVRRNVARFPNSPPQPLPILSLSPPYPLPMHTVDNIVIYGVHREGIWRGYGAVPVG
jgi:hypothetical protein